MPLSRLTLFIVLLVFLATAGVVTAQIAGPTSGELTVQLVQGLDSATDPKGMSQGTVMKSTNKAIRYGSPVIVGLASDPINGGYTAKLLSITINGQTLRAASVKVGPGISLPGFMTKASKESYSGTHVFLPEKTWVKFTLTEPAPEAVTPSVTTAPAAPEPKVWKLMQVDEIKSPGNVIKQTGAMLQGTASSGGHTSSAFLVMHCDFPTSDYPKLLPMEVILSPALGSQFPIPGVPVDVSEGATSQLGDAVPIGVNANGQDWTSGTRIRVFYELPDMKDIIAAAGQNLQLSMQTQASFALPADNGPIKQLMQACIQRSEADAAAQQAQLLASCPTKPGEVLHDVSVTYVGTGKEVKNSTTETGEETNWQIPGPAKGQTPRKTAMTCTYDKGDAAGTTEKLVVSLPSTARSCDFVLHQNTARNAASCVGAAPKQTEVAAVQPGVNALVSCPSKPGKALVNAEVYDEPGRTLIEGESYEQGFGASWIIHPEPGHHDILNCIYGAPGTKAGAKSGKNTPAGDQNSIPIPKEAMYCTIDGPHPVKAQCTKQ